MRDLRELYEQFVKERRYTKAVSAKTISWYWQSWKAFETAFPESLEALKRSDFIDVVGRLRECGVGVIAVNTYARAINAFLKWLRQEGHWANELRIPKLKEPDAPKTALKPEQVQKLLAYRPPANRPNARGWFRCLSSTLGSELMKPCPFGRVT